MEPRKKVLVAPLDWGLGHATRCIPIIRELLQRNCEVFIASSGRTLYLLEKEFPGLQSFKIAAYNPVYPKGDSMAWKMTFQVPKFLRAVFKEYSQLKKIVEQHAIDTVISDNRYGCYSKKVKSIFITHQVNILMPAWLKWAEGIINWFNHRQIKKFTECWSPVSRDSVIPLLTKDADGITTRHIGYLSRLKKKSLPKKYRLCVLCSGPEPQRTIFEELFREPLMKHKFPSLIICGRFETLNKYFNKNSHCIIANYLNSEEMNTALEESEIIISRPGYSTVMDLAKLGKKAIFIPTPGQTEQQYLSAELMKKGVAFSMQQSGFDLEKALKESEKFSGFINFEHEELLLKAAIDSIT